MTAVRLGVEVEVEALVTLMAPHRVTETRGGGGGIKWGNYSSIPVNHGFTLPERPPELHRRLQLLWLSKLRITIEGGDKLGGVDRGHTHISPQVPFEANIRAKEGNLGKMGEQPQ
eukprot:scaffold55552_cov75-Cyclotella_meneghiniana.AAC.1